MSPRRRLTLALSLPLLGFLILLGLLLPGLWNDPRQLPSVLIGQSLPAFRIAALEDPGRTLTPDDLKGGISLINVWATWCVSCRVEHETLVQLAQQGVTIYGVNYKDQRDKALQWLTELGNPYRLNIYDEAGSLGIDLGVYGAPETFLLDTQGVIRHRHAGPLDAKVWQEAFLPRIQALKEEG